MRFPIPAAGRLLVALALGSNEPPAVESPFDLDPPSDPRARALEGALLLLRRRGYALRAASPLYETEPVGVDDRHGPFLNACAAFDVPQDLPTLLAACQEIEAAAGRRTRGDLAPRPLDVDVVAAWTRHPDGQSLKPLAPLRSAGLTLPHPRLAERAFVLLPLVGLLPDAPLLVAIDGRRTEDVSPWQLLRRLARAEPIRGIAPGPRSASFPSVLDAPKDAAASPRAAFGDPSA